MESKQSFNDLHVKFSLKFSVAPLQSTNLMRLKLDTQDETIGYYLTYDPSIKTLSLTNFTKHVLVSLSKNDFLSDSYWNSVEVRFYSDQNLVQLKVNDIFENNGSLDVSSLREAFYSSWSLGGYSMNAESGNFSGCIRDIHKNGVYVRPVEEINAARGCPNAKISSDKLSSRYEYFIFFPKYLIRGMFVHFLSLKIDEQN